MIRKGGRGLKQEWPYLTGFGLAVAGAFSALGYLLYGGREQVTAIVAGLGLLAIAQLIVVGLNFDIQARQRRRMRMMAAELAQTQEFTAEGFEEIQAQLAAIDAKEVARSGEVMGKLNEIKSTFNAFHEKMNSAVANRPEPAAAAPAEAPVETETVSAEAASAPLQPTAKLVPGLADQIEYALEPVIDIPTQRTAHYRLHASLKIGDEALSNEALLHASAVSGKRPIIDSLAVTEALGLLRRLRQRDPHLCILVPMGSETLQNNAALADVLSSAGASPHANGLIIELAHVVLAGLGEQGLEGLALLARNGVVFALSQASVSGLDLDAMKLLNVKLVGLSAATLAGQAPSETLLGFAQMARLARVNIYVTDVRDAATIPQLSAFSRLACGPCFAPPRRVKRIGEVSASAVSMAA